MHLIHFELFEDRAKAGYTVGPGQLGENITTHGIDLLGLPVGTRLSNGTATVSPGDLIHVELPALPHFPLTRV